MSGVEVRTSSVSSDSLLFAVYTFIIPSNLLIVENACASVYVRTIWPFQFSISTSMRWVDNVPAASSKEAPSRPRAPP